MDYAGAKARLVCQTRDVFGERVTIRPMKAGPMKVVADPGRAVMNDVIARFDHRNEAVKLGGSNAMGPMMPISESNPSFSIPRAVLAWLPAKGDHIERASGDVFEIVRPAEDGSGAVIFFVSQV